MWRGGFEVGSVVESIVIAIFLNVIQVLVAESHGSNVRNLQSCK
jgi:hypothetical protein